MALANKMVMLVHFDAADKHAADVGLADVHLGAWCSISVFAETPPNIYLANVMTTLYLAAILINNLWRFLPTKST